MDTSEILQDSWNVLYGESDSQKPQVTLDNLYQLMTGIKDRLTTIEGGMTQITEINKSLTT